MTDLKPLPPIDSIKSQPYCKVIECAGHQVTFSYEHSGLKTTFKASIYYPGIGIISFEHKTSSSDKAAITWIETRDKDAARTALGKINEVLVKHGLERLNGKPN